MGRNGVEWLGKSEIRTAEFPATHAMQQLHSGPASRNYWTVIIHTYTHIKTRFVQGAEHQNKHLKSRNILKMPFQFEFTNQFRQ